MGTTFYSETENGGTAFYTERAVGDVRIANYVYDLWLPILGASALGVYAIYCRLERQGVVKALTLSTLSKVCRMGTDKFSTINGHLEDCGFIRIKKPTGQARLMHWTTEITVLDPPTEVRKAIKDKYTPGGYEILTPWLEKQSPENLDPVSGEPKTPSPEQPKPAPNVAPLGVLHPLKVEKRAPKAAPVIPEPITPIPGTEEPWEGPPPPAARVFQSRSGRWPARVLYRRIHEAVGDVPDNLEFWGEVVAKYKALGWNPTNVDGMLEWYGKRELPKISKSGKETRGERNNRIIAGWQERLVQKKPDEEPAIEGQYVVL